MRVFAEFLAGVRESWAPVLTSFRTTITFHKERFSSSSWWEILQSFYQVHVNHGHPCSLPSVSFHPALSSKGSASASNSITLLLLVYRGRVVVRCCRRGGRHRRLRNSLISREIKEGFNQLASRPRLRLHCTSQEKAVIAFARGYRTFKSNVI